MRRRLSNPEDLREGMSEATECDRPPVFQPGDKVRASRAVRNDGSFPGKAIGDPLIEPGEMGYVRAIGTFLQRYVIYEVDFLYRGFVVGMRASELELIEAADP
jgi:nitrogen fixation protein NifZ